jgi:hypothetical protein
MFRKVRSIATMGVIWALAWVPIALASVVGLSLWGGDSVSAQLLEETALAGLLAGGASGLLFGTLLAVTERQGTVGSLSTRRVVAAGVLAGLLPAGVIALWAVLRGPDVVDVLGPMLGRVVTLTSLLGAGSAAGLLWVARRAPALPEEAGSRALGKTQ